MVSRLHDDVDDDGAPHDARLVDKAAGVAAVIVPVVTLVPVWDTDPAGDRDLTSPFVVNEVMLFAADSVSVIGGGGGVILCLASGGIGEDDNERTT